MTDASPDEVASFMHTFEQLCVHTPWSVAPDVPDPPDALPPRAGRRELFILGPRTSRAETSEALCALLRRRNAAPPEVMPSHRGLSRVYTACKLASARADRPDPRSRVPGDRGV